jgi:hypothetical protein
LYNGNAALLTESLEVIQKISAVILAAIENSAEDPNRRHRIPSTRKLVALKPELGYSRLREEPIQVVSVRITQRFAGHGGVRLI